MSNENISQKVKYSTISPQESLLRVWGDCGEKLNPPGPASSSMNLAVCSVPHATHLTRPTLAQLGVLQVQVTWDLMSHSRVQYRKSTSLQTSYTPVNFMNNTGKTLVSCQQTLLFLNQQEIYWVSSNIPMFYSQNVDIVCIQGHAY